MEGKLCSTSEKLQKVHAMLILLVCWELQLKKFPERGSTWIETKAGNFSFLHFETNLSSQKTIYFLRTSRKYIHLFKLKSNPSTPESLTTPRHKGKN